MKNGYIIFMLIMVLSVYNVLGISFYDSFDNDNYTSEGWIKPQPSYFFEPEEINGYVHSTVYDLSGLVQNFSEDGFNFNTNMLIRWNSTVTIDDALAYTIIKLTNDDIYSAGTSDIAFFGDANWGYERERGISIVCEGDCVCTPNSVQLGTTDDGNFELEITTNPFTDTVTLKNEDGLFLSSVVTGCDFSKFTQVELAFNWVDNAFVTDFYIEDNIDDGHDIIIYYPLNDTLTDNINQNVTFLVNDSDHIYTICGVYGCSDMYCNSTVLLGEDTITNNTISVLNPVWDLGQTYWFVGCNDSILTVQSYIMNITIEQSNQTNTTAPNVVVNVDVKMELFIAVLIYFAFLAFSLWSNNYAVLVITAVMGIFMGLWFINYDFSDFFAVIFMFFNGGLIFFVIFKK